MVGLTIRKAISSLGSTLWHRFRSRSFHTEGGSNEKYTLNIREYITAIDRVSLSRKYQKAITSEFLQCMASATSRNLQHYPEDHAADVVIGAFFFPMRSCKFAKVPLAGRTVNIRLGRIRSYSNDSQLIPHHHPDHLELAVFVRVLFEDQKNRLKCDTRTQMKTQDFLLCLVFRLGRVVQQVLQFVKGCSEDTPCRYVPFTRKEEEPSLSPKTFVKFSSGILPHLRWGGPFRFLSTRDWEPINPVWNSHGLILERSLLGQNHDPRDMKI